MKGAHDVTKMAAQRADPASSGRGGADFPEGPTEVPPRELRQGSGEQPPVGSGAEPLVGVRGRSLQKLF